MIPLAFQQRGLWFIYQLEGPSATYNMPLVLRLRGSLRIDALNAAVHDVAGRHETLRTMLPDADGVPYQRILDAAEAGIDVSTQDVGEADPDSLIARQLAYWRQALSSLPEPR